ncbi:MAG: phytoene desaturase family protein [Pseudomonadota bacterium]
MSAPVVAVIGAGMGGLAAAIDLAAAGYRVNVYERSDQLGGKLHGISVGGHVIDSGPTVFTMRWIFDALFENAKRPLEDYVTLDRASTLARHRWLDESQLDLYEEIDASVAAIEAFSDQANAAAYRGFVRDAGKIFDTLDHSFMRASRPNAVQLTHRVGWTRVTDLLATKPFISLWNELHRRFTDQRLVQLFARYATYCGSNPFLAPATLMLIAEAERRGVWYVRGGMTFLAQGFARLLSDLGGSIHLNTPIEELRFNGRNRAELISGESRFAADAVVFNGDSEALATGLLGPTIQRSTAPRTDTQFSLSAVTLSTVAPISGIDLAHHTVLFSNDYRSEFNTLWERQALPDEPTLYLCCPAPDDLEQAKTERPAFILANAPARHFDDAAYAEYQRRIESTLSRHGVVIDWSKAEIVRQTPTRFEERFPGSRGALYGRPTHGFAGSFMRPGAGTRQPGLFLSGGSVHPGAGVPMATQSGRIAAAAVRRYLGH